MVDLRIAPAFHAAVKVMGEGLSERGRILLEVALDFFCWRDLAKTCSPAKAAKLMTDAIIAVSGG